MKKIILAAIIVLIQANITLSENYSDKILREETICPQILKLILKALEEESELKSPIKNLESLSLVYSNLCLERESKQKINVENYILS